MLLSDRILTANATVLDTMLAHRFVKDILTAMFAAEWMYWTWCHASAERHISDPDLRAWIDLHADRAFANQALWLKQAIDTYAKDSDLDRLSAIFDRVMRLEIAFHAAAYDTNLPDEGRPS